MFVDELAAVVRIDASSGNGSVAWICTRAANTCRAALVRTVRTSVQPVAISVTVSE